MKLSNGIQIINVTPHPITFLDNEVVINVEPCGTIINAFISEELVEIKNGVELVKTTISSDEENNNKLSELENLHPNSFIVGSILAAQAFPGRVYAMTPAPGFGRKPPNEKRMSISKFTTF